MNREHKIYSVELKSSQAMTAVKNEIMNVLFPVHLHPFASNVTTDSC